MKRTSTFLVFFSLALCFTVSGQENRPFSINGYLSSVQSATFDSLSGAVLFDNLLHNRLNLRIDAGKHFSFAAEFRNRLFTGDMVRVDPSFSERTGSDQGITDLSWNISDKQSFLLNSAVDRLWGSYHTDKVNITVGRQRINWGQTLVWNPNDIFNAYSFFDFDYIERPGSDAVRIEYFPTSSSADEIAVKSDSGGKVTGAALYRFNLWGYDFQFLGGYASGEDFVAGTGWSGAIGTVSFRGEATLFIPSNDNSPGETTLIATTGFEKLFSDNSTAQIQLMYCNNPLELSGFGSLYSGTLSAKSLAFSRFTAFGQCTWAVTPLTTLGLSSMWFPDLKGIFAGPSLEYSLSENMGFSLLWQHFGGRPDGNRLRMNLGFLRIKYSF